jgi:hypothetical protein
MGWCHSKPLQLIGFTSIPLVRKKAGLCLPHPICQRVGGTSSLSFCVFACHGPALPCHSIYTLAPHGFVPCAVFLTTKTARLWANLPPHGSHEDRILHNLLITLTPKNFILNSLKPRFVFGRTTAGGSDDCRNLHLRQVRPPSSFDPCFGGSDT